MTCSQTKSHRNVNYIQCCLLPRADMPLVRLCSYLFSSSFTCVSISFLCCSVNTCHLWKGWSNNMYWLSQKSAKSVNSRIRAGAIISTKKMYFNLLWHFNKILQNAVTNIRRDLYRLLWVNNQKTVKNPQKTSPVVYLSQ